MDKYMQAVIANVEDTAKPVQPRVIVTRPMVGVCAMQVCAVKDATDEEILAVCNDENPAGTTNGWGEVIRSVEEDSLFKTANSQPVQCVDHDDRMHFLVLC